MPSRTPFGSQATARRGETVGVPPAESAECSSRRLAARTVNCPYTSVLASPNETVTEFVEAQQKIKQATGLRLSPS
jgi:hypothetical protein